METTKALSRAKSERYDFLSTLRELDSRTCCREIDKLMTIAASASSTFMSDISIWLVAGIGPKEASNIMRKFHLRTDKSFQISHVGKRAKATTDESDGPEEPGIQEEGEVEVVCTISTPAVPYLSADTLEQIGEIAPTVRVGDHLSWVKVSGTPLNWWVVKEIRIAKKTLMLKNTLKCEYKELFFVQLYGAVVKRSKDGSDPICFSLPKPDFHQLRDQLEELKKKYGIPRKGCIDRSNVSRSKANVEGSVNTKVWTLQKEVKRKARILMQSIDPRVAKDKKTWLRIGRTLKSLSRGSSDLFSVWSDWTKSAELPGIYIHTSQRRFLLVALFSTFTR